MNLKNINEYVKNNFIIESEVITRLGLNKQLKEEEKIKKLKELKLKETEKFYSKNIYHISQIEKICKTYRLCFLQTKNYNGNIDIELSNKITSFEKEYNLKCTKSDTKILSSVKNFKYNINKESLMFYEINDEYFYLIHKWGIKYNNIRKILQLFESSLFCCLSSLIVFSAIGLKLYDWLTYYNDNYQSLFYLYLILSGIIQMCIFGAKITYLNPNKYWDREEILIQNYNFEIGSGGII